MLEMTINDKACRGCQLCLDVHSSKARVEILENCIACLSCAFICPSGAINHKNIHEVKNFYRNIEFSRRMERFL
jgi:ferredoxin